MIRFLVAAFLAVSTLPAGAQEVIDCGWQARADNLVEPWEENTRTFANGAVRVALLDGVEPAATSVYLLIISPPRDALGLRQCRVVAYTRGSGFYAIEFGMTESSYAPGKGLQLQMPAFVYSADTGVPEAHVLTVTINQSTGVIATDLARDPE